MSLYTIAIVLTIVANLGYHLFQRAIRTDASPAVSLMVTYATAFVLSACLLPWFGGEGGVAESLKRLGWSSYALGAAIVGLELGFLLAYRAKWDIGIAALYSNAAVALLLLPVGVLAFGEGITTKKLVGFGLALAGLVLLTRPGKT